MYTYFICCTANASSIYSIVLKLEKEIKTVRDLTEAIPVVKKEAEKLLDTRLEDFGILSFTKLEG